MSLITKGLKSILTFSSGRRQNQKLIILIYHRVLNEPDFMYSYTVDKEKFNWQMALLASEFNVLSLSDALNLLDSGLLPPRAVCITFDDGYADNYFNALPILKKYNLPATFFIVSGMLNQDRMWCDDVVEAIRLYPEPVMDLSALGLGGVSIANRDEKARVALQVVKSVKYLPLSERHARCRAIAGVVADMPTKMMLTSGQLKSLCAADGMEIGSHTVNHPILKNMPNAEWQHEILNCKTQLETLLNKPVRYFAYPNGRLYDDYGFEQRDFVEKCGYEAALSTEWRCVSAGTDWFQLPRFTPWDDSPNRFMLRMADMYWRG